MIVYKLNLIAIVAIVLSVSLVTASAVMEVFSLTNTSKVNSTRDVMGNFVKGNSTSLKGIGNDLMKNYPGNSSY